MNNRYYITSCGHIWDYNQNKFLTEHSDKKGYKFVCIDGKHIYLHRVVAEKYIPNPNNLETVDHIDNNKSHNNIQNLQWMTRSENSAKDKYKKVRCIETGEIFNSVNEAAKHANVSQSSMSHHLRGRNKTCAGLHWEVI